MPSGTQDVNAMLKLGSEASAQPNEIRERNTAAEDTLAGINADFGKAGTYDMPASVNPNAPSAAPVAPTSATPPPDDLLTRDGVSFQKAADTKKYDALIKKGYSKDQAISQIPGAQDNAADSIFTTQKTKTEGMGVGGGAAGTASTTKLDPDKAKAKIEGSSEFRQISMMTAESEQLLNRTGPLYDEMMKSTQLPIIEGAAASARENTENIRSAMARGGSARTAAFAAVAKIRAQDNINMQKGQALAQAHLQMDQWARDNAKNVINFAQNWAQNQAGIRSSFNKAMDHASDLMSESALPFMFATAQKAEEYRQMHSQQRRSNVTKWVNFALGIAATAYTGNSALLQQANTEISGENNKVGSTAYNGDTNLISKVGSDVSSLYDKAATGIGNLFGVGGSSGEGAAADASSGGLLTSDIAGTSGASLFGL